MKVCDEHLYKVVETLEPNWVIAVGTFAEKRAMIALDNLDINIGKILHPSPANPASNKGWAAQANAKLRELGVWI